MPSYFTPIPTGAAANALTFNNALNQLDAAIAALHLFKSGATSDYGLVGDGVTDDTLGLQQLLDDTPSGGVALIPNPSVRYKITAALDARNKNIGIIGMGQTPVSIRQATDNTPILWVGANQGTLPNRVRIENLSLDFATQQAQANADSVGLRLNWLAQSVFRNLRILRCATAIEQAQDVGSAGKNAVFSCFFDMIGIGGFTRYGIDLRAVATANTQNFWGHVYMTGSYGLALGALRLLAAEDHFATLNVEGVQVTQDAAILCTGAGNSVSIGQIHFEDATLGNGARSLLFVTEGVLRIGTVTIQATEFDGSAAYLNPANIFGFYDGSLLCEALNIIDVTFTNGGALRLLKEHTAGHPARDIFIKAIRDDDNVITQLGDYDKADRLTLCPNTRRTQTQILAATDVVNTKWKFPGQVIWDVTNTRPLWASGTATTAAWEDGSNNVVHTPS